MDMPALQKEIVICATQRCGSTLLCNDFTNNGLGKPEELFLPLVNNFEGIKDRDLMPDILRRGTSENGIFAVKVMANYSETIDRYLAIKDGTKAGAPFLGSLAKRFADAYWVFITRSDTVSQAVSRLMSRLTGVSHAIVDRQSDFVPGSAMIGASENYNEAVTIEDSQIQKTIKNIEHENKTWERFFKEHSIAVRRISYEKILDNFHYIEAIRDDLGLAKAEIVNTRNLVKLGNKKSEEIVRRYNTRHGERFMPPQPEEKKQVNLGIDVTTVQEISKRWVATPYYDAVEARAAAQWQSIIAPFLLPFGDIDHSHVLEIAVGHGRMTQLLLNAAERVTGVDVLQENIDFCANRFKDCARLQLIKTDGATLKEIAGGSVSFTFCFDSMVHFDSDIVRSYVRESRRVLKPGGYFFTHHSNNTRSPEGDFQRAPHARNFMSEPLFRHYAKKEGMEVAATKVIDWGSGNKRVAELDCLSLLRKGAA